jgi:hypothetical protein
LANFAKFLASAPFAIFPELIFSTPFKKQFAPVLKPARPPAAKSVQPIFSIEFLISFVEQKLFLSHIAFFASL